MPISATENCLIDNRRELTSSTFRAIVEKLNLLECVESSKTIVLKPNFAGGSVLSQDSHALTDIELLRGVIAGIQLVNPKALIYIAESDSAGMGFAFLKFANLGLDKWYIKNVELLDLSRDRLRRIDLKNAKYFGADTEQLWLSEKLLEAGMVISIANLKTHSVTKYTGTCKNLFGLLPRADKYFYHTSLDEVIYDLNICVKPQLSIVDGFRAMEGNGPMTGNPIDLGLRLYASNALMADVVACHVIRIKYMHVRHLRLLAKGLRIPEIEGVPNYKIQYRVPLLAFFNKLGFCIQRIGYGIYMHGHRIHCVYSLVLFCMMSVRPILLHFVDLETLQKWKRKYFKEL